MKTLLQVVGGIAALPALWTAGFILTTLLNEPDFEAVDLATPPRHLAVMGIWEDGGRPACRAFYYRDVLENPGSFSTLRYSPSEVEAEACRTSFRLFKDEGRWPHEFDWDRSSFRASFEATKEGSAQVYVVEYPPNDDYVADTRYEVDPETGRLANVSFRGYAGSGHAFGNLLLGALGGTLLWLGLLGWYVVRALRNRRGRITPVGSAL